ncbi:MAG: PBP1A family penicillin-binding protein [bacterium]|nr:PBP1A family penicillin-binding protein [bacterium]
MYWNNRKIWYWLRVALFLGLIVLLSVSIRVYRAYDVSNKDVIMNKGDTGLMLYDRTGELFFAFDRARPRIFVPLSGVPLHTQQAIVAAEDKGFFSHYGFSLSGIARSLYLNIKQEKVLYGGSTITQQLVKNSLLTRSKSIARKFQEIIIAVKLERNYSKKEILELYVNSAYFGEGVFGIEAAAKVYFNKGTHELTLSESAILAGLLPAPAAFSPLTSDEDMVQERQLMVLQHMEEQEYITASQKKSAVQDPIKIQKRGTNLNKTAPHFALMVKEELDRIYGEETVIRAGMKVTTTLDLDWQKHAELAVKNHVDSFAASGVGNGAAVVLDPASGEVRALVGSADWFQEEYGKANMAISPRQTGSAFKPIVYAAGLEEKIITAITPLHDIPTTFIGNYRPQNYDGRFRGSVSVRRALANSLNVPAVETIIKTGIPDVVALAKRLGISTMSENAQYNPSTALGAENITLLDLTSAYGALANNGTLHKTVTSTAIHDKYGKEIVLEKKPPVQALSPQAAFIISSIIADNKARAEVFGQLLTISRPAAVKTGTTQDYRDGWTVGYTPNLTVGVWIGNNDNTPMYRTPASVGAAPLWKNLMEQYLSELPLRDFIPPAGISVRPFCGSRTPEYFIPGTEPTRSCVPTAILTSPNPLPTP